MKKFLLIIFISVGFISCYSPRYVYSPSTQNIPLLKQKNDVEASVFYAGSYNIFASRENYNRGLDLHSAYAVSDHVGLMLNESIRWERNGNSDTHPRDSSSLFYKRNFTELGIAYYTGLGKSGKSQFQVFGGMALGKSKISDHYIFSGMPVEKFHNSHVTKIFIHPALIGNFSNNFSLAFASRITMAYFSNIQSNYTSVELEDYQLDSLSLSPLIFWEPALNLTFGFPDVPVKFRFQMGLSALVSKRFYWHRNSNVGVGIVYDFKSLKRK
jgi:hypothetical protein